MDFLQIKQVSSNYLFTKNPFLFYFSDFRVNWTGHTITEEGRGLGTTFPRPRPQCRGRRVYSGKRQGLLCKIATAKGYGQLLADRLEFGRQDYPHVLYEPVNNPDRPKPDQRCRVNEGFITSEPSDRSYGPDRITANGMHKVIVAVQPEINDPSTLL